MAIINQRWPIDLLPETCEFRRTRNDIPQISPRTRQETIIAQGRPLWSCKATWNLFPGVTLAKLRYWLESLEGRRGSVQIWNFGAPHPYPWGATLPTHWQQGATVTLATPPIAGAVEITISNLQPLQPAVAQGQHIQVGRRLYMATAAATADAAGRATVRITPPLLSAAGLLGSAVIGDAGEGLVIDFTATDVRLRDAACEMHLAASDFAEGASHGQAVRVSAEFLETAVDYT